MHFSVIQYLNLSRKWIHAARKWFQFTLNSILCVRKFNSLPGSMNSFPAWNYFQITYGCKSPRNARNVTRRIFHRLFQLGMRPALRGQVKAITTTANKAHGTVRSCPCLSSYLHPLDQSEPLVPIGGSQRSSVVDNSGCLEFTYTCNHTDLQTQVEFITNTTNSNTLRMLWWHEPLYI